MNTYQSRDLFGGAITVLVPPALVDASYVYCWYIFLSSINQIYGSQLRQVPDTQEVLLYSDSDISLIIEILERVEPDDFPDAAKFASFSNTDRVLSLT